MKNDGRGLYVPQQYIERDQCPPESSCSNERRLYDNLDLYREENRYWAQEGSDDSEDGTYEVKDDEEEEEPLEYTSDEDTPVNAETTNAEQQGEQTNISSVDDPDVDSEYSHADEPISLQPVARCDETPTEDYVTTASPIHIVSSFRYDAIYEHASKSCTTTGVQRACSVDADNEDVQFHVWKQRQNLEHIPGPGCTHTGGYSGHEVSIEEIKGCTNSQCLVRKDEKWQQEFDDQPFEVDSNYYLSGLSGYMPSTDWSTPDFLPARHGLETAGAMEELYHYVSKLSASFVHKYKK